MIIIIYFYYNYYNYYYTYTVLEDVIIGTLSSFVEDENENEIMTWHALSTRVLYKDEDVNKWGSASGGFSYVVV